MTIFTLPIIPLFTAELQTGHKLDLARYVKNMKTHWADFLTDAVYLTKSNMYSWVNQRLDRRWPTEG